LPRLRQEYGIASLALFGSYVYNAQRPGSDLDVLVSYVRTPTLLEVAHLQNELTDLLGVSVDLVLRSTLRPEIGRTILRDAVAV
jgi:predicted nucleotidyltransferase